MTEWTASEMGKKGGSSKSEAKQAAVRENGRKGGRPKLVWESEKEWTSARIFEGPKGWRIELDSRIQGEFDGRLVFVPFSDKFPPDLDMDGEYNEHTSNAGAIIHFCESIKGSRVLKKGILVE